MSCTAAAMNRLLNTAVVVKCHTTISSAQLLKHIFLRAWSPEDLVGVCACPCASSCQTGVWKHVYVQISHLINSRVIVFGGWSEPSGSAVNGMDVTFGTIKVQALKLWCNSAYIS